MDSAFACHNHIIRQILHICISPGHVGDLERLTLPLKYVRETFGLRGQLDVNSLEVFWLMRSLTSFVFSRHYVRRVHVQCCSTLCFLNSRNTHTCTSLCECSHSLTHFHWSHFLSHCELQFYFIVGQFHWTEGKCDCIFSSVTFLHLALWCRLSMCVWVCVCANTMSVCVYTDMHLHMQQLVCSHIPPPPKWFICLPV